MPKTLLTLLLVCTGYYTLAADISVTGTVLSLDGLPEGGVNVIVKGTAIATATDMNGHFTIHVPEGNAVLIFHFLRRKPVEHSILLRQGFQYQVNVGLSRKTQTFNKSVASTSSLPLNAPVIRGRITDEQNAPLANVSVTQSNNGFKTISDAQGEFVLPVTDGRSLITFRRAGSKDLEAEVQAADGDVQQLNVTLVRDTILRRQSTVSAYIPDRKDGN